MHFWTSCTCNALSASLELRFTALKLRFMPASLHAPFSATSKHRRLNRNFRPLLRMWGILALNRRDPPSEGLLRSTHTGSSWRKASLLLNASLPLSFFFCCCYLPSVNAIFFCCCSCYSAMIGTRPGQKASAKGFEKPRIRQKIVGADKKTRVNECAFIKGGKNTFISIVGI